MLKLRDDGTLLPAGGVPISPWVDLACTGETLETNAKVDLTATKASLQRTTSEYLQGADPRTPLASPLYADLSGLSPLLVVVGGDEALLDDSVRLARSAGMAGVDATLFIGAGMQHIFPNEKTHSDNQIRQRIGTTSRIFLCPPTDAFGALDLFRLFWHHTCAC